MKKVLYFLTPLLLISIAIYFFVSSQTDAVYVHDPTGLSFPPSTDELSERKITRFDSYAEDVGIHYKNTNESNPLVLSIFVYPRVENNVVTTEDERERIQKNYISLVESEINCSEYTYSLNFAEFDEEVIGFQCTHERFFANKKQMVEHKSVVMSIDKEYFMELSFDHLPRQQEFAESELKILLNNVSSQDFEG